MRNRQSSSIILRPTDEFEIAETIAGMNINKSPGHIDIPVILIKEAKFLIARFLARSFNECLETGNYPDILKNAKVIPLHKGGSKLDLGNYRLISILSPINKIFETILLKRLVDFWEKYNLFTNYQFGFRKLHSTNLAITYLHETILKERDVSNSVCGIFLDFAKAFDCVNHHILLDKLEHYGVRGNAICLLRSYLTNRFQYTENSDHQNRSNQLPITIGVLQGSVLGPFLFLVYINDLPNCCDSDMILYADDTVLLCADKNLEYLKKKSENEFCKIEHWIRINKLTLNYSKTNLVLFPGMKNKSNCDDNFCVNTNNRPITPKSVIKYLGVFIDHKLTWKNTYNMLKKNCVQPEVF